MSTRLAFNSYSIRDKLGNPEGVEDTFKKAASFGYAAVELDFEGLLLQFEKEELKSMLNRVGLKAISAHVEFERLEFGLDDAIENIKFLGLEYVAVPNLPRDRFCKDEQGYLAGISMLSSFGEKLNKNGIKFLYHNHAKEFEKFRGKTAMEIIFNQSNWSNYLAEIDVYWVQYGGGDPAEWIRKFHGRVPLVHIKDLGIVDGKPMTLEVGEGNMNWPYILEACKDSEVEWYIVEQDDTLRDSLESLKMSKEFLEKKGIV
jgi:sugar phosphate isomerase/epimerase